MAAGIALAAVLGAFHATGEDNSLGVFVFTGTPTLLWVGFVIVGLPFRIWTDAWRQRGRSQSEGGS